MNRFDKPRGQEYVSTRVPLPLDFIAGMAKDYSDKYHAGKASADKLGEMVVDKYAPIHQELANQYNQDVNKKLNDLVNNTKPDEWAKPDFQYKVNKIKQGLLKDERLGAIQNTYNYWDKEGQKYLNSDDYSQNINLQEWKNSDGTWKQTNKAVQNIDHIKYQNHILDVKSIMDNISVEGTPINSISNDGSGYFTMVNGVKEYIPEPKIDSIAGQNVNNYAGTPGGRFRFSQLLHRSGLDPRISYNEFMSNKSIPEDSRKLAFNVLKDDLKNYGIKQEFSKTKINVGLKNDVLTLKKLSQEEDDIKKAVTGQTISGGIVNLTDQDQDFKDLKSNNIYKENPKGGLEIDWTKLTSDSRPIIGYEQTDPRQAPTPVYGNVVKSDEKRLQLRNHITKIAAAIGYSGELVSKNYNDILNLYNAYSKIRLSDEQMAPSISKIESQKARDNWNNYDVLDVNSPDQIIEKPVLEKGDILQLNNFRNTPKGKMNRDGFIKKADGTIIPIMVRPKGEIDDSYHNTISEVGLNAAKWEIGNFKGTVDPKDKNVTLLDKKPLAGIGTIESSGVVDADTKEKRSVFLFTPLDPKEKPRTFNNQSDMMIYLNSKYYTTQTGRSEVFNQATKSKDFNQMIDNEDSNEIDNNIQTTE